MVCWGKLLSIIAAIKFFALRNRISYDYILSPDFGISRGPNILLGSSMTLSFASALVTGGAGFIGSHLVDELVKHGCRVTVLDDLSSGRIDNLAEVSTKIEFIQGDIRDIDIVHRAVKGCETVFHLAAIVSVPQTVADPLFSSAVNVQGTVTVLEAARRLKVRFVIFASSCAVYGDNPRQPNTEGTATRALSP